VSFPGGQLALGVNSARTAGNPSKPVRKQDQLHIHMAGIPQNVVNQLKPVTGGVQQWRVVNSNSALRGPNTPVERAPVIGQV
jgi:CDP-diacylglycerol pyrophosphatase